MRKSLIVLSLDSLGKDDASLFEGLNHFKAIIEQGSYLSSLDTIYPSLTYPVHATIITGRYPAEHGIIGNHRFQPGKSKMDWFWYEGDIQGDTLFKAAKRKGLKTAAILWPVSARGSIDYNIAEILPHRWWQNQIIVSLRNSTFPLILHLNKQFGHLLNGIKQPNLDDFVEASAKYILKRYQPDLMMVHFIDLDYHKHLHGIHTKETERAIYRYNQRIGGIINALQEIKRLEETNLVVMSDHSQLGIHTGLKLNSLFLRKGLIRTDCKGRVISYDAFMHSCEGSAYIYTNGYDHDLLTRVNHILTDFQENHSGIEKIFTIQDPIVKLTNKQCSFMLEAETGYHFVDQWDGEIIDSNRQPDLANHGYHPGKPNYNAVFMAMGPGFRKQVQLTKSNILDIGPTLAHILNVELKNASGKPMLEILV